MTAAAIEVLCCPLAEVDAAALTQCERALSADELQRLREFRAAHAAKEFLVGRALLRTALGSRLRYDPAALRFEKSPDGKPFLLHPPSQWQFNLTHCRDWVALALCQRSSIGVDIESFNRRNNLPAIAKRFFSDAENALLARYETDGGETREWLDHFFAVWTLKEAHAKALGCGLPKILNYSSIAVDLARASVSLTLSGIASTSETISSRLYKIDASSALAVIVHGNSDGEPQLRRCVPSVTEREWSYEDIAVAPVARGRQSTA